MFSILRTATAPARFQTRCFASSARRADLAKLTLIGRLGRDPQVRTNVHDKEYVAYTVATNNPPGPPNENGMRPEPTTSWHYVLSFGLNSNNYLKTLQKGTLVYVEANYELREADPTADPESPASKRQIFLRHESIRVLSRPSSSSEQKDAE